MDPALFRRCIPPVKGPQGEKRKSCGIEECRKDKHRQIQLHLGIVGPHAETQKGVRKRVPPSLGGEQQAQNTSRQAEGNRRGKSANNQTEKS